MASIIRAFALCLVLVAPGPALAAVVLQYHHVSEETPAATSVTPEQFEAHLERLEEEGFRVLPLDELIEAVRGGLDGREKVAAITFDDGFRNVYENAIPLLEERGWKATLFVFTESIRQNWKDTLSVKQLRELHDRGHLIANHSQSHLHMVRRRPDEKRGDWLARLRGEILGAQQQLEEWLGEAPPRWLAYPYGESDPAVRALVDELGFIAFGQHTGALGSHTDWLRAPRIPINRHYADWDSLRDKVLALPLPVLAAEPRDEVTTALRPELTLVLKGDWTRAGVNCFAAGRPADTSLTRKGEHTLLRVSSDRDLSPGRQRYNCTAPAGDGRFFWYSWQWMRKDGGDWYPEP